MLNGEESKWRIRENEDGIGKAMPGDVLEGDASISVLLIILTISQDNIRHHQERSYSASTQNISTSTALWVRRRKGEGNQKSPREYAPNVMLLITLTEFLNKPIYNF